MLQMESWVGGSTNDLIIAEGPKSLMESVFGKKCSLKYLAKCYGQFIMKPPLKFCIFIIMIGTLVASIWGLTKVTDGLDLTDVVPQGTIEHSFLSTQGKYFGFYNMYAVTQGDFEYPTNQKLLYEYHEAFMRVPNVIKNDDGGLPEFWLGLFRDWLTGKIT